MAGFGSIFQADKRRRIVIQEMLLELLIAFPTKLILVLLLRTHLFWEFKPLGEV